MDMLAGFVRQHLIDPKLCMRCGGCEAVCPNAAIFHAPDFSAYAIDPDICNNCLSCMDACSTGAIESWRYVPDDDTYTLEMQFEWHELPRERAIDADLLPAQETHGPPASAGTPEIMLFGSAAPAAATIIENRQLCAEGTSSDVRHIVLTTGAVPFPVLEGQSVGVLPPGTDETGQPHGMRVYSIASQRDGEGDAAGHIALTVKRVTTDYDGQPVHGVCSNYLCDRQPSETVRLIGPIGGSFLMPDDPRARLLMICTGTGIAPMRGMIARRKATDTARADALHLYFGVRTTGELLYGDELQADADANLIDLHVAYSREASIPRRYVQDLLSEDSAFVADTLTDPNTYIYLCGLKGMEAGVLDAFAKACAARNLDWDEIHTTLRTQHRLHIETY